MSECVIVTTYQRPELLRCTVRRIREADERIPIHVWADRGTSSFGVGKHGFYGNSYNTMEAFKWAVEEGYDLVYLIEDDVFVYPDFFAWHRAAHDAHPDIFASCAWTFNRHAPICDGPDTFAPWYYSIGTCFKRDKLALVTQHANISYYSRMQDYIVETFPDSKLNHSENFYEQDGLIQHVLERVGSQVCWPSLPKCCHLGARGYNKPNGPQIADVERFYNDIPARIKLFGESIVRREEAGAHRGKFEDVYEWTMTEPSGTIGRRYTKTPEPPKLHGISGHPQISLYKETAFKMLHECDTVSP